MLDFVKITEKQLNGSKIEISPTFIVKSSLKDIMFKGGAFYAFWDERNEQWCEDSGRLVDIIDKMLYDYYDEHKAELMMYKVSFRTIADYSTNKWNEFLKYCKSMPNNFTDLNQNVIFSNTEANRNNYSSFSLPYPLHDGDISAYDEIMSTLYDPEERRKIEWVIGSVIAGDSKWIQKFMVLYGAPGSGKSTVLNIIEQLLKGYVSNFESKQLGNSNASFAMESLKDNPLVAVQHEGDLSRIEDNTRINSIVSHENLMVNEKYKSQYSLKFRTFLIMATNKPVKITDAKSGIIRRLIDVVPSGRKIGQERYYELTDKVKFELSGIASHCLDVYERTGPNYYSDYIPTSMMGATNDFFSFIEDNYDFFAFENPDEITLKVVWLRYQEYAEMANIPYKMSMRGVKMELMNYYQEYIDRENSKDENGNWSTRRNIYRGFLKDKFQYKPLDRIEVEEQQKQIMETEIPDWLNLKEQPSMLDKELSEANAQYAKDDGKPSYKWENCKNKVKDLDTSKTHYVQGFDPCLICIDFDIKNDEGQKDFKLNALAASKWPKTYAELSNGGEGLHLHYWYDGDPDELSRVYDENIEIKVFKGGSSLRRRVSKCNDLPIAHISAGLPKREVNKIIADSVIKSEKALRAMIIKNLRKEIHRDTTSSVNFIYSLLEDAYNTGMKYDVTDMRNDIQQFAMNSTNQADHCLKMVGKMRFKSEEPSEGVEEIGNLKPIVFYDVEVLKNLFIVCWKILGKNKVVKMINPTPEEIDEFIHIGRLVGFNNRKYDNHILYGRMLGYTNEQLYELSQNIIMNKTGFFGEAYNLSYTDIYDFMSSGNKMSLKKWEIKLGIHHQELGWPWDQPLPEDKWEEAADYCCNDVEATEAVWNDKSVQADWEAREILADLSGKTRNDTTNTHTTKLIVGNDPNPQSKFIYTNLAEIFPGYKFSPYGIPREQYKEGAKIVSGKSIYKGEDPGEGGRVYSSPGMYFDVALLDIMSMHPHAAIKLKIFGEEYTKRFEEIVHIRIYIKHKEYDKVRNMFDGKLAKYLDDPGKAKALANALKTAINSVYGLTSAKFDNKLRDPRNRDNIVAKYGGLFMMNLQEEVTNLGYKVVHIKTDSIKIANADMKIINFVNEYGKKYGYTFEHEATYQKMCIVNEAVYIAQYAPKSKCEKLYGYVPGDNQDHELQWTATGTQFQVPYVFKTLFSHEKIQFEDMCETKSVTSALYLDFNENLGPDEHDYRFVGKVGLFCPVKPGVGGGVLLRDAGEGKFAAATGTKKPGKVEKGDNPVYMWMESEMVKELGIENQIDRRYYDHLVDEAVATIGEYGDTERFMNGEPDEDLSWMLVPDTDDEELPFDIVA